jgi:hypothetical protein
VIIYDVIFYILLLINVNLFFADEINLYRRRKRWQELYLKHLSEFERKQREKRAPEYVRVYKMLFRSTSIVFIAHVLVTLYSEVFTWWYQIITKAASSTQPIDKLPVEVIWKQMLDR